MRGSNELAAIRRIDKKAKKKRPASVEKGGFIVITQKGHPFEGDVAEFMGEGMRLKEEYFGKTKPMYRFKLVRGDAMGGHECYVDEGGGRPATASEIRIARGY
jgi:hypothetical protein